MHRFPVLPTLPSLLAVPDRPIIHRDLSWLQFNERVLDEARPSSGNPLLERLKFLAISASNLDEFFMIRFAALGSQIRRAAAKRETEPGVAERLEAVRSSILEAVAKFGAKQVEGLDLIVPELETHGVHLVRQSRDSERLFALGKQVFETQIVPKLNAPETFDPQKIAYLENLKIAVVFPDGLLFRVSRVLPLIYASRDDAGTLFFFFLDDLLLTYLGPTFGLKGAPGLLRLTRDADFTADIGDQDPASIPDIVRTSLGSREKGAPVRLQYTGDFKPGFLEEMSTVLRLVPGQILPAATTLCLHALWSVYNHQSPEVLGAKPELRYQTLTPRLPPEFLEGGGIFEFLDKQDFLLHHPYDTFDAFVAWVGQAALDPKTVMIEQTIYRMDRMSPLIDVLKQAATTKRVRVIIELRARFDEFNNLRLADDLRKSGVEVAFGFGKLKMHAKVTLVTRQDGDTVKRYTHLSTGNYNATTARQYTDMAILTGNPEIGADARLFFDAACEGKVPHGFKKLVSAPTGLHRRLLAHIEAETAAAKSGKKTRIVAKVNALVDEKVIDALYTASQAGVSVHLIVRGACSLIPGVRGLSENIRVISVVDRFLEHSRIYYFESEKALYLSSADWMPRNFFSRLELAFPVLDPRLYQYIEKVVIPTYLSDNMKARELTHQGLWKRRAARSGKAPVRSQYVFEKLARGEYDGTTLRLQ